jgi:hypothetical protein
MASELLIANRKGFVTVCYEITVFCGLICRLKFSLRNKRNRVLHLRSYDFSFLHMITKDKVRLRESVLHLSSSFCQDAVADASAQPVLLHGGKENCTILCPCSNSNTDTFIFSSLIY